MTKFLLIRHATTDAVGKTLVGRAPGVRLNAEGLRQAENLAERLDGLPIAAVYSSPLERAIQTAEPLAKRLNLEISVIEDLTDLEFGDWTNRAFEDLNDDATWRRFNSFRSSTRIPGGETMLEAQTRIINSLEKLRLRHSGQTIAIISHADLIKATAAYYAGIHLDMFQRIEISPASITIIEIGDDSARILLVNDTGKPAI